MANTKKAGQGAVSSIADGDLVMCSVNGVYHPISLTNLMKAIKSRLDIARSTAITLNGDEWVRIAKSNSGGFSAILTVSHSWSSGRPTPLVCFVNGSAYNADSYYAEQITTADFYKEEKNPPSTSNAGLSFTSLRFVKENNDIFVEVKFKPNARISTLFCSLAGQTGAISFVTATVSTADNANVLKTIEFSGGGITGCYSASYAILSGEVLLRVQKGGAHEPHPKVQRSAEIGADCHLSFGSLDSLCRWLGNSQEVFESATDDKDGVYGGCGRVCGYRFVCAIQKHSQFSSKSNRLFHLSSEMGHQRLFSAHVLLSDRWTTFPSSTNENLAVLEGGFNDCSIIAGKEVAI